MARLHFIDDGTPGYTRRRIRGKTWAYYDPEGVRITDREEIDRLNAIALPPAYENCWFAPRADAHLLAYGYDAKGRKQYRYHTDYRAEREARKFDLCLAFGERLPRLREKVESDLASRGLTRDRAIASVISLLDTCAIRVGNECYAQANKSFGATTLRARHATIKGRKLRLRFKGKSGKLHEIDCDDRALVRCVRAMQDLPGQRLFQYLDDDGSPTPVHSHEVNAYLREVMGEDFTAKDFRTWSASVIAFGKIHEDPDITLKALLADVSERLGNTPAIARKSYVHPAVIAAVKGTDGERTHLPVQLPRSTRWLSREERGLLVFLASRQKPARKAA